MLGALLFLGNNLCVVCRCYNYFCRCGECGYGAIDLCTQGNGRWGIEVSNTAESAEYCRLTPCQQFCCEVQQNLPAYVCTHNELVTT